jgi:hypothetical protein
MELQFKQWLEAARWKRSKWEPPPRDAFQRLRKYNKPGFYCHFTFAPDKLGVNPKSVFHHPDTPFGIYAYTVPYVVKTGMLDVPYGSHMTHIWVFKARHPRRIKKIKDRRDKNGQLWVKGWEETDGQMGKATKWFLDKNIEGFIDEGTATIHPSEPYQCVFFGSQTVNAVDVFANDYSEKGQAELDKEWEKSLFSTKELDPGHWFTEPEPEEEPEYSAYGPAPWD